MCQRFLGATVRGRPRPRVGKITVTTTLLHSELQANAPKICGRRWHAGIEDVPTVLVRHGPKAD